MNCWKQFPQATCTWGDGVVDERNSRLPRLVVSRVLMKWALGKRGATIYVWKLFTKNISGECTPVFSKILIDSGYLNTKSGCFLTACGKYFFARVIISSFHTRCAVTCLIILKLEWLLCVFCGAYLVRQLQENTPAGRSANSIFHSSSSTQISLFSQGI